MPYLIDQPLWPVNGSVERSPAIMAKIFVFAENRSITDLPWGQLMQFITHLHNAGLTGDDVMKLLDNPEQVSKMVEATKSILDEPIWDPESRYFPTSNSWEAIASNVQIKRPVPQRSCCTDSNHILVRVTTDARARLDVYANDILWEGSILFHLSDSWVNITPSVQVRKDQLSSIAVRTLRSF